MHFEDYLFQVKANHRFNLVKDNNSFIKNKLLFWTIYFLIHSYKNTLEMSVFCPANWYYILTDFIFCGYRLICFCIISLGIPWWFWWKESPPMQETWVPFLGLENPLEEEMATHSSILAWRIPWTEEPSGLESLVSQRVGHIWETNTHWIFIYSKNYIYLNLLTSIRNHYLKCVTQICHLSISYLCICAQSCSTPCDPMDCSPPGSSVYSIFQQGYWTELPFLPRDSNSHLQHCKQNL